MMRRVVLVAGALMASACDTPGNAAPADRPLQALTASAAALRHGPCAASLGIVPDEGCPGSGSGSPTVGDCAVLPHDNPWNTDISAAPVHPRSAAFIANIQAAGATNLHPDFGSNPTYGFPWALVPAATPTVPIVYGAYGSESDPGPFPIPLTTPVESGSDHHVLVVQQGSCVLYELFAASVQGGGWHADSGARWDLSSNALRTEGWTSADAAGLPIFPGLVRYDEVAAGAINHALRFTVQRTQSGHVLPATHNAASSSDPNAPPMGLRLRLRADFDRSPFTGQARVVLDALARFGMIVADNGSNWFISGDRSPNWDDEDLNQLKTISGSVFEVVDTGAIRP